MKNVLIYGGAFNPVTRGHLLVASHVLNEVRNQYDEVWFMPDYKSLWGKNLAVGKDRMNMLACTIRDYKDKLGKDYPKLRLFDYLIRHKLADGTIDIVDRLLKEPLTNVENMGLLIGMDQANIIHKWLRGEELIEKVPFVVVSRPGISPTDNPWYKNRPHKLVASPLSYDISSSMVRYLIKDNGSTNLVSPSTMKYIKERGLYV